MVWLYSEDEPEQTLRKNTRNVKIKEMKERQPEEDLVEKDRKDRVKERENIREDEASNARPKGMEEMDKFSNWRL